MSERPYLVKRDGKIHDRATGALIGEVRLREGGWTGTLFGPGFPEDPWAQERVDSGAAGRRWSVARAVWEAHQQRRQAPLVYDDSEYNRGSQCHPDKWRGFRGDPVQDATVDDLGALSRSPRWEDRIRAEALRQRIRFTLPDGFPCLYEVADSPTHERHAHKRPHPWVKSPDVDMLHALLPDYQRLWDSHTSQWGPDSRRVFAVGPLDGLSPGGVFLPGSVPDDVLVATISLHSLRGRAPQDLRDRYDRRVQQIRDAS